MVRMRAAHAGFRRDVEEGVVTEHVTQHGAHDLAGIDMIHAALTCLRNDAAVFAHSVLYAIARPFGKLVHRRSVQETPWEKLPFSQLPSNKVNQTPSTIRR